MSNAAGYGEGTGAGVSLTSNASVGGGAAGRTVRSLVPARMDRLPWTRFHWLVIIGLGVSWILDGLEIQIASTVGTVLQDKGTLHISSGDVGTLGSVYLLGEVVGALVFGRITDMIGRKRMFVACLGLYLVASGVGGLSFSLWFLLLFRFLAGMGIGGEYTAINSAIDELIPSHYRGRVDIAVNGTYWGGAIIGTLGTFIFLNVMSVSVGWRIAFLLGPVLGLVILVVRRHLPESPRWQVMHGREREAEESISFIEHEVEHTGRSLPPVAESRAIELRPTSQIGYFALLRVLFREFPGRSILGATLMITQSFLYNAIFFTYSLVLKNFFQVGDNVIPLYFVAFAVGNLAGPLLIGHLFDTLGRKKMIAGTYILSGVLLAITAALFQAGALNAITQTICWTVIFFFASASASSAYLTVSEVFPMESRAMAIAFFYALGTGAGGLFAPWLFGILIGTSNKGLVSLGYYAGAILMLLAAGCEVAIGVKAERKSLESIAQPLSAAAG